MADVHLAAVRADLERVSRVAGALAFAGPTRAVIVCVLALAFAHATRNGAVHVHKVRILGTLTLFGPVVAVDVDVGALRRTQPARGGALLVHVTCAFPIAY